MSLKSFFQNLFGGLKQIFKKLPQELKDSLHIGVTVVDAIKKFTDSGVADVLTAIIPGEFDDKIKLKLRAILPKILLEMKLADRCTGLTDPAEIVKCAVATLQQINGDWISESAKKNFFDSLAVMITQGAADGKFNFDDIKLLVKFYYDNIYKPKP